MLEREVNMNKPKNLNQLKKYISINMKFNMKRINSDDIFQREIIEIKSNAIGFIGDKIPVEQISWIELPKASDIKFYDDKFVIKNFITYYYI